MIKVGHTHIECPGFCALAVLATESPIEFGLAIAGGAARDAFHDVEPNDHDIILYGYNADEHDDLIGSVHRTLVGLGYSMVASYDGGERYGETPQLVEVDKLTHPVYPSIDLLFYPDLETLREAVVVNDFNINHFAVVVQDIVDSEKQQAYYFGETNVEVIRRDGDLLPVGHYFHSPLPPEQPLKHLAQAHPVSPDRLNYIREKAHSYGWTIPDHLRS